LSYSPAALYNTFDGCCLGVLRKLSAALADSSPVLCPALSFAQGHNKRTQLYTVAYDDGVLEKVDLEKEIWQMDEPQGGHDHQGAKQRSKAKPATASKASKQTSPQMMPQVAGRGALTPPGIAAFARLPAMQYSQQEASLVLLAQSG